jgi:hypothetical protein
MLDPRDTAVYLEALRPPPGHRLEAAIATTYSLDLVTLLAIPLSFARLDMGDGIDELLRNPIRLLHALREQAHRLTIFCQAGRIAVPARRHALFAHLESSIHECQLRDTPGELHAKTWFLRFREGQNGPVVHRFLCLSRNLTSDRSWDTALALEGPLRDDRVRAFARNRPLRDFLLGVRGCATRRLDEARERELERMADEVIRVEFAVPEGFEDELEIWPVGLPGLASPDLELKRAKRAAVISPFVGEGELKRLVSPERTTLLSRQETLDAVSPDLLSQFERVCVLQDTAVSEDADVQEEASPAATESRAPGSSPADERGLHAKLYVADDGWYSDVWTGSSNASKGGMGGNVEMLVRLRGRRSQAGVEALVGANGSLCELLQDYAIPEAPVPSRPQALANEELVEKARRAVARAGLRLAAAEADGGFYGLTLVAPGALAILDGVSGRCWPALLHESHAADLRDLRRGEHIDLGRVALDGLSAFVCFELAAGSGEDERVVRFALLLPLDGAPETRLDALLAAVLSDPERFLAFILALLRDGEEDALSALDALLSRDRDRGRVGSAPAAAEPGMPLLEDLLRAAARHPERLAGPVHPADDLRRTPEGVKVLPPGFLEIWDVVRTTCAPRGEVTA